MAAVGTEAEKANGSRMRSRVRRFFFRLPSYRRFTYRLTAFPPYDSGRLANSDRGLRLASQASSPQVRPARAKKNASMRKNSTR